MSEPYRRRNPDDVITAKRALRARLLADRAGRDDATRSETARRHGETIKRELQPGRFPVEIPGQGNRAGQAPTVAAYAPVGVEPGPPDLPDRLLALGWRILLPIVTGRGEPLLWAAYDGRLETGPLGLRQPTGPPEPLRCDLVIAPALAVDRRGARLGRGGGYYDRALGAVADPTPVLAIVFDSELLDAVPTTPQDHPVDAVITPQGGLLDLRRGPGRVTWTTVTRRNM